VPVALAPIVPLGGPGHHFVTSGFATGGDPLLERWLEADPDGVAAELVFRIPWPDPVGAGVAAAAAEASAAGRRTVVNVELPLASESVVFDDDGAVADRVAEAVAAANTHPEVVVFLDGFMDHDRSYYPRHGLIDRRSNPRPALYRLIEAASQA
jgi:hypothetical protein